MKGNKTSSDNNKTVYQISLSSGDLDLINPYLYIEKLQEEITNKVPNVKVIIICNAKAKSQKPIQLKCFATNSLLDYQVNNLKEEINNIAFNLKHDLSNMLLDARESVA